MSTATDSGGAPLLERDAELAAFEAAWSAACAGEAQLVVVEGSAGIGKSRLLAEARHHAARSGGRVLAASASTFEREFPFGVVRQLFEPALADPGSRARWVEGAAASAEAVFSATPTAVAAGADFAVLHGLYWLTVNATADAPLLLVVDDLQWADVPSLRFLAYLVRRLEDLPLLLVVALRTGEAPTDLAITGEILGDPHATVLRPAPLGERSAAALVRGRLGDTAGIEATTRFAAACHEATGGNPLFLHELIATAAAEGVRPDAAGAETIDRLGPRAVSRTVLTRLARLDRPATAIAHAVAILGDGCRVADAAALAGIDMPVAAAATGALAAAEILRPEPPLAFVHPLVRAAVELDIPPGERELAHGRAARLLRDRGAAAEAIAAHLLAGPPQGEPWAADALVAAGEAALRRGAPDIGVSLLAAALDEPLDRERRPTVLMHLGMTQAQLDGPSGIDALRAGRAATDDPRLGAEIDRMLARTLLLTRPPEEGAAVAREAARSLPDELRDQRYALEALEMIAMHFGADPARTAELTEARRDEDLGPGTGARMLKGVLALSIGYSGGSAAECARLALDAVAGGDLLEADDTLLSATAESVLSAADRPEVLDVFEMHAAIARRKGTFAASLTVHLWKGLAHLRRGELADADELLHQAEAEIAVWGSSTAVWAAVMHAETMAERGDLAAARARLAGWTAPPSADPSLFSRKTLAMVELAEGNHAAALALTEGLEHDGAHCRCPAWLPWRSLRARALDGLGRAGEALEYAEEELALARRWGSPGPLGQALRTLATMTATNDERRFALLEEAVETLDGSTAKLELAKAQAALGTALRHARRPADAREPLRRALEGAAACGAARLAEHVRTELQATGARPRRDALTGVGALTASEARVARLAVAGRTNRDIAQEIYVTPKTVELHLSNAYRKLGIGSRRELAAALGDVA